ncbi:MAG: ERAP1-like C-terminal domain-containing protein [Betaproteobacteria bacterium]
MGDPAAEALLAAQAQGDRSDEGRRQAYAAGAARPAAQSKREYFAAYLGDTKLPERWAEDSLSSFNAVEQETLSLPWLEPALRALPELKRTHKIFFVNNWLGAFLGGQRSREALAAVEQFLQRTDTEPDLRLKVLESIDALERTVRIRARYAN